jgi:HK97 gp10 family phage protein
MSSDGVQVRLMGDRSVKALFKQYSGPQGKKAIRAAFRAGAKVVTTEARKLAPKKRGTLKKAIRTRAGKRSRRYIAIISLIGEGFFKGKAFYGGFQEFGWKAGKRPSKRVTNTPGDTRKQIPGKHFMERAAKSKERAAVNRVLLQLRRELDKIDKKAITQASKLPI